MVTAQFDNSDNYFVGFGTYAIRPLRSRRIFFEASFAVGGYHQGTYVGKQADDILFRSSIGVGHILRNDDRLSISLDSLLDTKLTFHNPGKEALLFRYTSRF